MMQNYKITLEKDQDEDTFQFQQEQMLNEQQYIQLRRESEKKEKSKLTNIAGIIGLKIDQ